MPVNDTQSKSEQGAVLDVVVAAACVLAGVALFTVAPMPTFLMVGTAVVVGAVAYVADETFRPMAPALAVQAGHFIGLLASALFWDQWPVGIAVVVFGAGLFWLAYRPSLGAVIFLSIYQVIFLVLNLLAFEVYTRLQLQLGFYVNMVFQGLALVTLWIGWTHMCQVKDHADLDAEEYEPLELLPAALGDPMFPEVAIVRPARTERMPGRRGHGRSHRLRHARRMALDGMVDVYDLVCACCAA